MGHGLSPHKSEAVFGRMNEEINAMKLRDIKSKDYTAACIIIDLETLCDWFTLINDK